MLGVAANRGFPCKGRKCSSPVPALQLLALWREKDRGRTPAFLAASQLDPAPHLPSAPHGKPWPSPASPPPPKAFFPQGPPYSTIPPVLKAAFSPGGQGCSPKGRSVRHRSQKVLAFACWGHQYNIPGCWESAVLCGCPEDLPWGGWTEDARYRSPPCTSDYCLESQSG